MAVAFTPILVFAYNGSELLDTEPPVRKSIVDEARTYLGIDYKFGGESTAGFDCSGFAQFVFKKTGVNISRTAKEQAKSGRKKQIAELNKGDLVFFGEGGTVDHVAIVIRSSERNLVVVHSTSSKGVIIDDIYLSDYWKKTPFIWS